VRQRASHSSNLLTGDRARTRTEAGIARAKKQGKKFGRPSALDVGQKRKIAERYAAGETMAELASGYEVGEATIFRALQGPFEAAA
jgi:DNA invertase Pin-like site-specific DNA recombinase